MRTLDRTFIRLTAATLASAATVGALGLVAPATASAATKANAPEISATLDGNDLTFTIKDPNTGLLDGCAGGLVDAARGVEVADKLENLKDVNNIVALLNSGVLKGSPAITTAIFRTSQQTVHDLPNGVYVVVAACAGVNKDTAVGLKPVIVPSGIGSTASVLDLGSTVLENPQALPIFLKLMENPGSLFAS